MIAHEWNGYFKSHYEFSCNETKKEKRLKKVQRHDKQFSILALYGLSIRSNSYTYQNCSLVCIRPIEKQLLHLLADWY